MLGTAKLRATGASQFNWINHPSLSTSNASAVGATACSTTTYHVKATSSKGCVAEDSIEVKLIKGNIDNGYLMPSAFTPNGDGKNDCFGVKSWGAVTNFTFSVFDRFGTILFTTTDPANCWDGTYKSYKMGSGTFVYQVKATTNCGPVFRKGTVVLIR